jgi:hypothetical protein
MSVLRLTIVALAVSAMPAAAGTLHFQNDEFNFHAAFPEGSRVCQAVSSQHPYGYFSWYGQPTACDGAKADANISTMGVYATYNVTYQRSPWGVLPKTCRPVKPDPAPAVDAKTLGELAFRRYKSVQCVTKGADGSIDIEVVTQAGKWVDGNEPSFQTPLINYRATLHTSADRLDKDLPMFRQFLSKVDIKF